MTPDEREWLLALRAALRDAEERKSFVEVIRMSATIQAWAAAEVVLFGSERGPIIRDTPISRT